jgi:broad specificity phosphatase PhoE
VGRVAYGAVLILVRHGRTAHNAAKRLLGRIDLPLDALGCRQATALGGLPELSAARRVVCSPLARARQTASVLGPKVTVDERWTEIDYGIYDGLPLGELPADLWANWDDDTSWTPEGGESMAALGARVADACEDLWEEAAEADVVVVSHVSPIKAAVAWGMGAPVDSPGRLMLDVASICRIGTGRRGPVLTSFNDISGRPSS